MMAMPPINPLQQSEGAKDYFDRLVEDVSETFEREANLKLDFTGYHELMEAYKKLNPQDPYQAWYLAQAFSQWEDYFVGCLGITQKLLLDSETTKKEQYSRVSIDADKEKVNNGKRIADMSPTIVQVRKNRNAYVAFYEALKNKIKFLQNAHFMAKKTWELGVMREQQYYRQMSHVNHAQPHSGGFNG